jgi:cephalosporin-C deacetylase-like acetyl esterase
VTSRRPTDGAEVTVQPVAVIGAVKGISIGVIALALSGRVKAVVATGTLPWPRPISS